MKEEKQLKELVGVSAISSAVCNLKCSFCFLSQNKAYKEFNEIVRKAWQDGSYVTNMRNTVLAYPADPLKVEHFQLWGGETLLSIEDVAMNVEKIYKAFPNIERWSISTNWSIDVSKFFKFLETINKYCNKKTTINLQLSIDGPEGEISEKGHHVSWSIYYKNFEEFTNLMNNNRLKNIKIDMSINATVSKELYFKHFSTYEGIYDYVKKMYDLCLFVEDRCVSESLEIVTMGVFPGYAVPFEDTMEDGLKLAEICRLWEKVRADHFSNFRPSFGFFYGIGDINENRPLLAPNVECGELNACITINPDGSLCECSGSYIDHFEPYLEELKNQDKMDEYNAAKLRNYLYYNPSKMTVKERDAHDWFTYKGYKNNSSTYMTFLFALAEELALSGQIPYKYWEDKELLLKHLSALSNIISCTRNNIKDTGVPYLTTPSCLRRYLNGVMEYAYDMRLIEEKKRIERMFGGKGDGKCC